MESHTKETIIIVHGTWAAPKSHDPSVNQEPEQPDPVSWYQIPPEGQSNFVSKLNSALQRRGSVARCWAHCKDNSEIFSWSGENAWIDRTRAALHLAGTINKLRTDGWRCHVVAHSHGGNVVAEALPQIESDKPSDVNNTITTLGTPFIDTMTPIMEIIDRHRKQQVWVAILFIVFLILFVDFKYVAPCEGTMEADRDTYEGQCAQYSREQALNDLRGLEPKAG